MQKAESFYLDFIVHTGHPDIPILHQVNVLIINHLQTGFAKYPVEFINMAVKKRETADVQRPELH